MKESLLNVKSKEFALQIIKLCNQINPLAGDGNPFVLTVGHDTKKWHLKLSVFFNYSKMFIIFLLLFFAYL